MSITASEIFRSVDLGGGAYSITEQHTDSAGKVHEWRYVAASGTDTSALMASHAAQLASQLAETEATEVIG